MDFKDYDEIIIFHSLSREDLVQIVDIQLRHVSALLAERDYRLVISPEARAYLAEVGYDADYGARPLKRAIQRELQDPLAVKILSGDFHEGETIHRSSHAQIWQDGDRVDEAGDAHTAHDLFRLLQGKDCVVAAHVGGRYADIAYAHDGALETAVELHSAWGTFEWILHDAFAKGYRVGVVCNSDGHKGRPGADFPGASFFGASGGLTCFLAPTLDRDVVLRWCSQRR